MSAEPSTKGAAAPPPTKKKRRILRVVLYVLATPLVLAALALAFLHTGAGKERVRAIVLQRLGQRVEGSVELAKVDYALFGQVEIGGLRLKDASGAEAVSLGSLVLRPSWGDLLGGRIVLDSVAVSGVAVHVVKDASGGSNLQRLLKPQPPDPNKRPLDKRITVKALTVGDVAVDVTQPDGTKIVVSDVGLEGALAVLPSDKTVDVEIGKIALSALVDKGEGGLKAGVVGLRTGLSVKLDKGAGKATLHPMEGRVSLTLPGKPERGFDIALAGFSADIGEGGVGLSLEKLFAGAVALASVEIKGKLRDGKIDGEQKADVLGLKLSAARVNELLGKDVLAGDIDVETHIAGPADKIQLSTRVTAPGAGVSASGSIGVEDPASPSYDVAVTVDSVDTDKLLAPAMGVQRVVVEKVEAKVKGKGRDVGTAGAVASLKVSGVTARGVRVDGVELEGEMKGGVLDVRSATVSGLGQKLTASGQVEIKSKRVDLTLALEGDVGDVLGRLKAAGLPVKSNLPRGAVRLPPGDLAVTVKGHLDGVLDVEASAKKLGVFGGTLGVSARASLTRHDPPREDGKKVTVSALDADLRLAGVKLSSILAMRGKKLEGLDGVLSGEVHVEGSPDSPKAKVALGLATSRADGGKTVRLALTGDVDARSADVEASLLPSDEATALLGLKAKLPLSLGGPKKGIDPYRPLSVHVSLPKRALPDLWTFVPKSLLKDQIQTLPRGDVELALDVEGTAAKPQGKLHLGLTAAAVPGFEEVQKLDVAGDIHPVDGGLAATVSIGGWLDSKKARLLDVKAGVRLSRSPVLGPADLCYEAKVLVGPLALEDLFMADPKVRAIGGAVLASVDVAGDREDLTGTVVVSGDGLKPGGKGPLGLGATVGIGPEATTIGVTARGPDGADGARKNDLVVLSGKVGLAGKKLFAQLKDRAKLDPTLALALDVPRRTLASLAFLRPDLEKAPGELSGSIAITGTARSAVAKGSIQVDQVEMVSGAKGGLALAIDAGGERISAVLGAGLPDASIAPLEIAVGLLRADVAKLSAGQTLPVSVTFRASAAKLEALLPVAVFKGAKLVGPDGKTPNLRGALDWNMDVALGLSKTDEGVKLAQGTVKGALRVRDASLPLPGTKRVYRDLGLELVADDRGLHLDALRARESDDDVKDRAITVKADIGLDRLKPTTATVSIDADRWLLFGPKQLGAADAPRGTLTLGALARADLTKPIRKVTVDVKKLELLVPERFERAHQPEDVQAGDLVFLGQDETPLGKLPLPASLKEKLAKKESPPEEPKKDAEPAEETGTDIDVHIADGAHLLQAPIDLWPKGDVTVKIRPGGREIKAHLTVTRGGLSLGGADHALASGSIRFDAENPGGAVDLVFRRPMRAAALRQISEASGGTAVEIHMTGSLADRKTVLRGAGTAGALWDVLAMHNTGRARYVSEPDLPWSMTSEFPQHDSLLVLGFMAVNLPHLLFVDRFAAWGDPYDDPRAYGRITHFEAERFVGDALRLRVGARPQTAGQSEAEVEIDYVLVNVPRMLLGVGITGGTRGGGGPGLVWEWSSRD